MSMRMREGQGLATWLLTWLLRLQMRGRLGTPTRFLSRREVDGWEMACYSTSRMPRIGTGTETQYWGVRRER